MKPARIIDVNYYDFQSELQRAAEAGHRVEKTDKQEWAKYVRAHQVPEAAMMARARSKSMSGECRTVIIRDGGPWDGYYAYSTDEQFSIKFEPARE